MGSNSSKYSQIKILKPHAHLCIMGRKSTKFQINPMKDVGEVTEARSWLAKFKSDNSVKNRRIKILKPSARLHIIAKKPTTFQVNPMKDV